ncbi:MAG: FAD-dependent oxidoreductase [Chloroflexi bacterium]|nr:FAD-dependent oxidoreductase [Chloroflexota bacterium]
MDEINLTIDGIKVTVPKGTTVLQAAESAGIYIPSLCSHPDLPSSREVEPSEFIYRGTELIKNDNSLEEFKGCQLCIVEIEGIDDLPTACTTEVAEGMVVYTDTSQVQEKQYENLKLILYEHPNMCLTCVRKERCAPYDICLRNVKISERCLLCPKNGHCELQKVVDYIGIEEIILPYTTKEIPLDKETPLFDRDYNLCIGCTRCVRVCNEVREVKALGFVYQDGKVIVGSTSPTFKESECKFCGACAEVCPTGAITDRDIKFEEREAKLVPCRDACPAGIDIPRYVRLIKEGKFDEAVAVIRETVPFPATLGYVCLHVCEDKCRHCDLNETVAIRALKRFATERDTGLWKQRSKFAPPTGKRVAIVGSGPAGLTAAYYLTKLGHSTTVFESLPVTGGMMRVGIPRYRLPAKILDDEIEEIKSIGVEIKTNTKIESLDVLLKDGYDAILVTVGAHQGIKIPLPGSDLDGVLINTSFLRDVSLGKEVKTGKAVVVVGGGNVAFDCARTALRLGATDVHLACLECKDGMLARADEIEEGEEEGVIIHASHAFVKIVGDNGHVTGIECRDVQSFEFDSLGRLRVEAIPGSEHILSADTVIFAVGQVPELGLIDGIDGIKTARRRFVEVDSVTMATGREGIFAAGDAVTGTTSIIEAIDAARRAATYIDRYLGGSGDIDEVLVDVEEPNPKLGREEGFADIQKLPMPCLTVEQRSDNFNMIELGLGEDEATKEAARCLQCDLRLKISEPVSPPTKTRVPKGETVGV